MFGRVSPLVSCSAFVNWSDCWCQHLFTSLPSNRFLSSPVKPLVLDGWTTKQQIRLAIVFLLLFVIICFGFVVGRYFWIAVHCFTSSIQSLEPFISIDDSWYSCVCFCLFLFVIDSEAGKADLRISSPATIIPTVHQHRSSISTVDVLSLAAATHEWIGFFELTQQATIALAAFCFSIPHFPSSFIRSSPNGHFFFCVPFDNCPRIDFDCLSIIFLLSSISLVGWLLLLLVAQQVRNTAQNKSWTTLNIRHDR